jgi:hypothetical protein
VGGQKKNSRKKNVFLSHFLVTTPLDSPPPGRVVRGYVRVPTSAVRSAVCSANNIDGCCWHRAFRVRKSFPHISNISYINIISLPYVIHSPRRRKWDVADPAAVASGLAAPPAALPHASAYGQYTGMQTASSVPLTTEEASLRATALLAAKAIKPMIHSQPQAPVCYLFIHPEYFYLITQRRSFLTVLYCDEFVQPPSEYTAELGINHVRADIRLHLTNRATHDEILRDTGASVIVRHARPRHY